MKVTYKNTGSAGRTYSKLVVSDDDAEGKWRLTAWGLSDTRVNVVLDREQCEHLAELLDPCDGSTKIVEER